MASILVLIYGLAAVILIAGLGLTWLSIGTLDSEVSISKSVGWLASIAARSVLYSAYSLVAVMRARWKVQPAAQTGVI